MRLNLSKGKELGEKLYRRVMKMGRRNIAIGVCSFLIVMAVVLNVALFNASGSKATLYYRGQSDQQASGEENGAQGGAENYFASTLITRQRSRDEALSVLQTIVENEASLPDSVADAIAKMNQIAMDMENESNIETLVKGKGFEECVAVISEGKCTVIVKTDGLLPNHVAQIQEIVYEQAGILPENVKMVEKQA